jgi:hypothetical protein
MMAANNSSKVFNQVQQIQDQQLDSNQQNGPKQMNTQANQMGF